MTGTTTIGIVVLYLNFWSFASIFLLFPNCWNHWYPNCYGQCTIFLQSSFLEKCHHARAERYGGDDVTWSGEEFVWNEPLVVVRSSDTREADVIDGDWRVVMKHHQLINTHRLTSTQRHQSSRSWPLFKLWPWHVTKTNTTEHKGHLWCFLYCDLDMWPWPIVTSLQGHDLHLNCDLDMWLKPTPPSKKIICGIFHTVTLTCDLDPVSPVRLVPR